MKPWFSIVLIASGCGAAAQLSNPSENLTDAVRSYNDGVRWERFAVAANHVPPKERGRFVEEMDRRSEEMRITDYELVTVDARGPREARVHVKVSWYKDTEHVLRLTHAVQTWERHGKVWWMVDEAKLRGADMPGLADRGSDTSEREPNPL
jgi:hypothetical protein